MANLLLTSRCVRSCPYCFAKREMTGDAADEVMGWGNLVYLADFLLRSGETAVSLLGGEPTLHPDYVDVVLYFVERGFRVTTFTSGILSDERLSQVERHLTSLPQDRLHFVCNLNDPEQTETPAAEGERVRSFLRAVGPWTNPGFNIYRPDFSLAFVVDLTNRFGLQRSLRLGLAHPVVGAGRNLMPPEAIGDAMARLWTQAPLLDRFNVKLGFDCGFPLCRFTDEQLGWLLRHCGGARFGCGPALDVTPDMSVYACFPLSRYHRRSLFEFDDLKAVADYYAGLMKRIRMEVAGIFGECETCRHLEDGLCAGGGVCQLLDRLADEAPVRLEEILDGLAGDRMPARA